MFGAIVDHPNILKRPRVVNKCGALNSIATHSQQILVAQVDNFHTRMLSAKFCDACEAIRSLAVVLSESQRQANKPALQTDFDGGQFYEPAN
jgi:hypothetical protein